MTSKILNLTPEQVVDRAKRFVGNTVKYHLEYPNGGSDPETITPFDLLNIQGVDFKVADCIGFALWCQGISRRYLGDVNTQPFPDTPNVTGGYINCTSLVQEAVGFARRKGQPPYPGGRFFRIVTKPVPGDLIVFSGRTKDYPVNPKHGHIGVIVAAPDVPEDAVSSWNVDRWTTFDRKRGASIIPSTLRIVHCSGVQKRSNKAVRETDARPWYQRSAYFIHFNREGLLK
mgnify:CR=1 FL=1